MTSNRSKITVESAPHWEPCETSNENLRTPSPRMALASDDAFSNKTERGQGLTYLHSFPTQRRSAGTVAASHTLCQQRFFSGKEYTLMWTFITQLGLATTIVDFTNALSPLLVGLESVVWLSAGMIVFAALQHVAVQNTKPSAETTSTPAHYKTAA